jgi:hypothetical protein
MEDLWVAFVVFSVAVIVLCVDVAHRGIDR